MLTITFFDVSKRPKVERTLTITGMAQCGGTFFVTSTYHEDISVSFIYSENFENNENDENSSIMPPRIARIYADLLDSENNENDERNENLLFFPPRIF